MSTNQENRHFTFKEQHNAGGVATVLESDHLQAYLGAGAVAGLDFNGTRLDFINKSIAGTFAGVPEAMQAFAVNQGFTNWNSIGGKNADEPPLPVQGKSGVSESGGSIRIGFDIDITTGAGTEAHGWQLWVGNRFVPIKSGSISASVLTLDIDGIINIGEGPVLLYYNAPNKNLLVNSEIFTDALWLKTRSTVSGDVTVAPDGKNTADELIEDSTPASSHFVRQRVDTEEGQIYTLSFFGKRRPTNQARNLAVVFFTTNGAYPGSATVCFDLTNGTPINAGSGLLGVHSENAGNGFWRVGATAQAIASTSGSHGTWLCLPSGDETYDGDGVSGAYIWGAQLEKGGQMTPYQRTLGSLTGALKGSGAGGLDVKPIYGFEVPNGSQQGKGFSQGFDAGFE